MAEVHRLHGIAPARITKHGAKLGRRSRRFSLFDRRYSAEVAAWPFVAYLQPQWNVPGYPYSPETRLRTALAPDCGKASP